MAHPSFEQLDFRYGEYSPTSEAQKEAFQGQSVDLTNDITRDLNQVHTVYPGLNGSSTSTTTQTYDVGDMARPSDPNDFLATAKNRYGNPAQGNLTSDCVVTYQGMTVEIGTLERMGVVARTDNGKYFDPTKDNGFNNQYLDQNSKQQQNLQPEEPKTAQIDSDIELFQGRDEEYYQSIKSNIPENVFDSTVAKVFANGVENLNIQDVARDAGLSVSQAETHVNEITAAFTAQANKLAESMGVINSQDCWDYLATNHPRQHQAAMQALVFGRSTAELRQAIKLYSVNVAPDNDSMGQAGYNVFKGSRGESLITINGFTTTVESAKRAGLI